MEHFYEPTIFNYTLESISQDDYIIATYFLSQETIDHLKTVGFMSLESSTGGWIDFPGETKEIRHTLSAKILGYYPIPSSINENTDTDKKSAVVQLGYPIKGSAGSTGSISMLMTCIAGNILEMPGEVYLLDISLPKPFVNNFQGPKFGVKGIREYLEVGERPLVNMMIKPKTGLTPDLIQKMAYEAGLGGVDHIKDDEISSDNPNCSFEERITAVMAGLNKAEEETGNKAIYTVNITDIQSQILDKAKRALELGANGIMLNNAQGFESLRILAESKEIDVPILYHPAGMTANKSINRMVVAKLARLCGADLYLTGSPFAKWSKKEEMESTVRSAQIVNAPFYHINESFIVQSSTAGKVPTIISDYGFNTVLGGGGAIHGHPDGVTSGVKAVRQAIDLAIQGESLEERKNKFKELSKALELNPVFERPSVERF